MIILNDICWIILSIQEDAMALLNRLLGKKNITGTWVRDIPGPLLVDLDRFALGSAKLGERFEALCFLGPDSDPYTMHFRHDYHDLGISVEQSEDGSRFDGLTIDLAGYKGHAHFAGMFLVNNAKITITKDTPFEHMQSLFVGWSWETFENSTDDFIEDARFVLGHRVFEPSWNEGGALCDIEIYRT